MYLAYSLLLTLGLIVLIPHFLIQAFVHGKYIDGLRQRLGALPPLKLSSRKVIWLHCVSVGETQAARPLVERLRKEFPEHSLVVSTITITGQNLARKVFDGIVDQVFYFPFDWRWSVRRSLKRISPDLVLIMETELWPNFLRECRSQNIPVALVNGRISRQSFRRYQVVRFFLSRVLADLNLAVMQSKADAERIGNLGLNEAKILTSGNLKFDANSVSTTSQITETIQKRFNLGDGVPVILAASTHAPEEKIVIESLQELRRVHPVRLMIAPRRPERFHEVAQLLAESGLSWVKKTDAEQPSDSTVDAILLDTIGELPAVYSLATIVFVGGSIADHGGHNVLEPAAVGTCVVTGHHTHNFHAIIQLLNEADAIIQLPQLDHKNAAHCLTHELQLLLTDEERRCELAQRAKAIVQNNQGATERTIAMIRPLIDRS
jgi:3-deoxy-D-manno-octulosonic-acid transferase